ncbi:MAG TPA: F0F1 ATP synthase subunit gamma [Mycobacteriales bacterium]|nr:F0F1 ATP synthase subunit gamma [Mycobacteriales bacterium]
MGAQLRVYRRRIRSVQSTKKITRAMELIAASRIVKAQQRVQAAQPYARQITRVISALASQTATLDHPLLQEQSDEKRAAVLVITSDRGLAGGYNANALKTAAQLEELLRSEGKEPVPFLVGRKAVGYYKFRGRSIEQSWTGFSEQPAYENAREVADALIDAFIRTEEEGGVGEIHVVHTEYVSALSQKPVANRVLPLVVEEVDEDEVQAEGGALPLYEFEPSPEALLDTLLPRYVQTRVYAAMLEAAAAESASRRRAMKAATDNAEELIKDLTRQANSARQAEITQEISEIVGGAAALSDA